MIQRYLRVVLTSLALVLAIAGSVNLNRAGAQAALAEEAEAAGGLCQYCGCNGGTIQCCSQGNIVCYLR